MTDQETKQTRWTRQGGRTDRIVARMTSQAKDRLLFLAEYLIPQYNQSGFNSMLKRETDRNLKIAGASGYSYHNKITSAADFIDFAVNFFYNYHYKRTGGNGNLGINQHIVGLEQLLDYHMGQWEDINKELELLKGSLTDDQQERLAQYRRKIYLED